MTRNDFIHHLVIQLEVVNCQHQWSIFGDEIKAAIHIADDLENVVPFDENNERINININPGLTE